MGNIDPSICPTTCNLISYGDFEDFVAGQGAYYSNFVPPYNSQIIDITTSSSDDSVDVPAVNGKQYLRFIRQSGFNYENVLMPLCTTVDPVCEITVSFDACADLYPDIGQPVTLGVWVLSQLPSSFEMPPVTCNGLLYDNSGNLIGTCIGQVDLPTDCETNPINFTSFAVSGSFTAPVSHIWFFGYPDYTEAETEVFLDNVSVISDCQNEVVVTPTVLEACVDGQGVIDLEVCLNGSQNTPATVTLTPDLQGISGISLSASNPDFPNGVETVAGLLPGQCSTPALFLAIDASVPAGVPIIIPVDVAVVGACAQSYEVEIMLVPENCDPLGCGCPSGSILIGAPGVETLLSDLVPGILPATPPFNVPLNLTIQSTLVIDPNVIFGTPNGAYSIPPNSDICMAPGAEIRVEPNNTLSIFDSHIRGCDEKWKSITVQHDATLNLVGDGLGLVEDGQYAVHPHNKAFVNITSTTFNKNYIALYFNDPGGEFFLHPFFNNTMRCDGGLLPHFDSQDPNDGPWSFAGIRTIGQGQLTIGVQNGGINTFDGLRNGIFTDDCYLTLRNSRFDNIQYLDYTISGFGVRALGEGQNFVEDGTCYSNNAVFFDNCNVGIYLEGLNAWVHNNEMTNVAFGITVRESANRVIDICGNTINCSDRGISLWFNDPAQQVQVNNNDIDVTSPLPNIRAAAIFVREHGVTQPDAHIEFHDNISIFNAGSGISLGGTSGYNLEQNAIVASQIGSLRYAGINLWNSDRLLLSCNDVSGDYGTNAFGSQFGPFGIRVRVSTNARYQCNDVQNTYLGVQFDMPCGSTDFQTTDFRNHGYGLHYTSTGNTGLQPPGNLDLHGNRWLGTWGTANAAGARHESSVINFVNASRYFVTDISAPTGPENPESVSNTWFLEEMRPELSCDFTCNVWDPNDPPTDGVDDQIASGQLAPGVYDASTKWLMQRQLYCRLHDNPALIQSGSVMDSFYNANCTTTIGQFVQVENAIHTLYDLDAATESQLDGYRQQTKVSMDSVGILDSLLQGATGQDSLDLLDQRHALLKDLDSLSQLNAVLVATIAQNWSLAANSVIAQNNTIATTDIWEDNEKNVNHIYLNTLVKEIAPNGTQISLLRNVASQCPYEGGAAVFGARALLDGLTEDVYDDEVLCAPSGQQLIPPSAGVIATQLGIQVYPNPTDKHLTIQLDKATETVLDIRLLNTYGQTVATAQLPEQVRTHVFGLPGLPNGIYWLAIRSENKLMAVKRIVVNK